MARFIFLIALVLVAPFACAAQLHGMIYDTNLRLAEHVLVEIDTKPLQRQLSVNSSYAFEVPPGNYTLTAIYRNLTSKDSVHIVDNGEYRFDLFLFPDLSEDAELYQSLSADLAQDPVLVPEAAEPKALSPVLIITMFLSSIAVIAFLFLSFRTRTSLPTHAPAAAHHVEQTLDEEPARLVRILEENGGRMTQKDLRKQMGDSEAKVSLLLTELEHARTIQRIKKGRGNIIRLLQTARKPVHKH